MRSAEPPPTTCRRRRRRRRRFLPPPPAGAPLHAAHAPSNCARSPPPAHIVVMALLCGLCEVLFDVDAGNQVQHCVPAGAFSDAELADIAFSAFPVRLC